MDRSAIATPGVVTLVGFLVLVGAAAIYYYTLPPTTIVTKSTSSYSSIGGSASSNTTESQTNASVQAGPSGGTCVRNSAGQCETPRGVWADYLGYIPPGYTLATHYPEVPVYPCPSGMSAAECAVFQQSCGNGVCDPNESCATCPIDCGVYGIGPNGGIAIPTPSIACNPYTGRLEQSGATPITVCQVTTVTTS